MCLKVGVKSLSLRCSGPPQTREIGHFTVVCLVTWPWIGSEAGGDLVLIQTSLLFICRSFSS